MFSFLVPQSVSVTPQKKNAIPTKDEYEKAVASYLSRHPETTEDDFDMIRKEKGDLECLFLWGATSEDLNDAGIIARYDPERTNPGTDKNQPSMEEKKSEPVVETQPSLSVPTFTAMDTPNEPVLKIPSNVPPPAPMLFIPTFFDLSQPSPVIEVYPPQGKEDITIGNASHPPPQPLQQPSMFLPNFTLFNETAPATLLQQTSDEESKAPASTSLFLPAFFDISPRRCVIPFNQITTNDPPCYD